MKAALPRRTRRDASLPAAVTPCAPGNSPEHTNTDRYLRIVKWARKRYAGADGLLTIAVGKQPSTYTRIEHAAFRRYVDASPPA